VPTEVRPVPEERSTASPTVTRSSALIRCSPWSALRETLKLGYEACRAAGRAFVTPDLLLALAQTPPRRLSARLRRAAAVSPRILLCERLQPREGRSIRIPARPSR
jgi:hypothetical protein